ncbi:glycosyl hydrolase family protein [Hirsutella rhossiliensis]|uniref:lytic cellulose monooxygenase (C4-dehydrogenating) n=1 Tax=Hirsutella rhossiliensis TaxID=111463 RepID=A0A9P8SL62_9HYPO|nr:glycosyl hydrolase family protein [Hirsutella rhossiliensis]KAH0966631.1 glycosyl hydrolase family protein [Hirsutella rhossiliensis]
MKLPVVVGGLLGSVASAHTLFTTLFVNGKNQGDGTCVRMPHDSATANGPVYPITGDDMACGRNGGEPVAFTCPAPREATLTFEFRVYSSGKKAGAIADDHKGPCAVYVKKVNDMYADKAAGPGWFKIWEDGYDAATGKWCVDKLIDHKGLLSVQLPGGLPAGYYLVRPEILALHNVHAGDAQFYLGCAQVFVDEGPRRALEIPREYEASIPGHVDAADAGLRYSIYRKPLPAYPMPGPKVYVPTVGARGGAAAKMAMVKLAQKQGVVPSECLIKNANWCGKRLAAHSDQRGCWAAVDECYRQSQTCWDGAPPSGDANCDVWQAYCREAESGCQRWGGAVEAVPGRTLRRLGGSDVPGHFVWRLLLEQRVVRTVSSALR